MSFFFWFFSFLPFSVLHRISDFLFLFLYYGLRYRRGVVRENLRGAFPKSTDAWRVSIEKQFYRNLCDLIVETLKTTTLSEEEIQERSIFRGQDNVDQWFKDGVNLDGVSSHLANWEWLGLITCYSIKHQCYAVYKPLSSSRMNAFMLKSRARLGLTLISMKDLRAFFELHHPKPFLLGLLSDQAPHDYSKAFEIEFLNQKTYFFSGPGILAVKYGLTPCWGWMKRVGRSRFEWGLDPIVVDRSRPLTSQEHKQIEKIAVMHALSLPDAEYAFLIVKEYARVLEARICEAPADWLWSHRRWKKR